ncbi:hypothetical protein ES708_35022 [subsurface metagenome]
MRDRSLEIINDFFEKEKKIEKEKKRRAKYQWSPINRKAKKQKKKDKRSYY